MLDRCNEFLSDFFAARDAGHSLVVLEAGGGSFSYFSMPGDKALISLDIELGQLVKNKEADLCVQADVHAVPLVPGSIDAVICFNVLEHLQDPEQALGQLVRILRPGGVMVLGCPVRSSLKGIVTRLTPTRFHRWYYKHIVGKKDRGDGHFDVFPTPFKSIVGPRLLRRWCASQQLDIAFFESYDGAKAYGISSGSVKRRLAAAPYYLCAWTLQLVTFGYWRAADSDLLLVAVK